jgi:hypothetical protein
MRSVLLSPKEYRAFAAQCIRWATRSQSEEHKRMLLRMANHWIETAQGLERASADRCVSARARLRSTPRRQDEFRKN